MKYFVFFLILSCTFQFINSCYKVDDVIDIRDDCYIDYKVDSSIGDFIKYSYKNNQIYALISNESIRYFDRFQDSFVYYEIYKTRNSYLKLSSHRDNLNTIIVNSLKDTTKLDYIYKLKNNLIDTIYENFNNKINILNVFTYNSNNTIKKVISRSNFIYEYEYYEIPDIYSYNYMGELNKFYKLSTNYNLVKSEIKKDFNSNILSITNYTYVIDSIGKIKQSNIKVQNRIYTYDYTYHCD